MARKWSNLNIAGALHYVTGNIINRFPVFTEPTCCTAFLIELSSVCQDWQKINYIHNNPVKAGLVRSAKDYWWSSFRSFYCQGDAPLAVDHDWRWPDDAEKLSAAMKELGWYSYWKRKT